jgi:hypothetical protein
LTNQECPGNRHCHQCIDVELSATQRGQAFLVRREAGQTDGGGGQRHAQDFERQRFRGEKGEQFRSDGKRQAKS